MSESFVGRLEKETQVGLLDDASAEAAKKQLETENNRKIHDALLESFYLDVREFVRESLRLGDRPFKVRQKFNYRPVGPKIHGWELWVPNAGLDEQVLILVSCSVHWSSVVDRPGIPIFDDYRWNSKTGLYKPPASQIVSGVREAMVEYLSKLVSRQDAK